MTSSNAIQPLISDEMLGAYMDNELDEIRRMEVEASLAANPEAAKFVAAGIGLRSRLHRLFDGVLGLPLPAEQERLVREFECRTRGVRRRRFRPAVFAGGALAALVTVSVFVLPNVSSDGAGQQLFALFQRQQDADKVATTVSAVRDQQPAAATGTIMTGPDGADVTKTVASVQTAPKSGAPDFSEFGFELISTRLLAKTDGRSMQLVYESNEGSRVELFFSPRSTTSERSEAKTSLTVMEEGPISVLFWHDKGRAYSLIGDVDRDTLLGMGRVVNGQWTIDLSARDLPADPEPNPKLEVREPEQAPATAEDPKIEKIDPKGKPSDGAKLPESKADGKAPLAEET